MTSPSCCSFSCCLDINYLPAECPEIRRKDPCLKRHGRSTAQHDCQSEENKLHTYCFQNTFSSLTRLFDYDCHCLDCSRLALPSPSHSLPLILSLPPSLPPSLSLSLSMDADAVVTIREKNLLSRLLYPNPVCLLSVSGDHERNIMTVSWLTCIDNCGNFICSLNKKRHTVELLRKTKTFVLNVPVQGQESLVLAIGSATGRQCDKFELFDVPVVPIIGRVPEPAFYSGLEHGAQLYGAMTADSQGRAQRRRQQRDSQEQDENNRYPFLFPHFFALLELISRLCTTGFWRSRE